MSADETDRPVGKGSPPKHSQFQKGQSGNKKGRPRLYASEYGEDLPIDEVMRVVKIDGVRCRMTVGQIMERKVADNILRTGDPRAFESFVRATKRREEVRKLRASRRPKLPPRRPYSNNKYLEELLKPVITQGHDGVDGITVATAKFFISQMQYRPAPGSFVFELILFSLLDPADIWKLFPETPSDYQPSASWSSRSV